MQGRTQVFINTEVPKCRLGRGGSGACSPEISLIYVCILRSLKVHKLFDNNIGLKSSQWAVAQIIFQDNRFLNMRIRLNVSINDPYYKLEIDKI